MTTKITRCIYVVRSILFYMKKKETNMEEAVFGLLIALSLVILFAWRILNWIWLKPMRVEKYLRQQGITGPPYRFLYGNMKETVTLMNKERSKPMELSHHIVPRLLPFVHQTLQSYGKMFVTWHGPTPKVTIMDPELIKDVLTDKFGHTTNIRPSPLSKLLAKGVVNYHGEKWVKHRRIITTAFHVEKLKLMLPAFYTSCSELVSRWQNLVSNQSCQLDVWPDLQNLTADVISRTAFGSSYEEGRRIFQLQTEQTALVMEVARSIYVPGLRFLPTKRNRRLREIYTEVRMLLLYMIKRREKAVEVGEASKDDLLGILMDSNRKEIKDGRNAKNAGMSIDEVIEECKLFYFAGQETTTNLLVWTMIVLSMHPQWQEKARKEVLQVFGSEKPNFEGLNQLKTVMMIFYEVLRLYPPLVFLTRGTREKMKLGEVTLPAGVHIQLPMLFVHRDPGLWGEDAEEFNPDRFSGGILNATKNRLSFFPFGWGPRICIGQNFALLEAKMAMAMILQKFSFELSAAYIHAPSNNMTVQPQHGAHLILHKV